MPIVWSLPGGCSSNDNLEMIKIGMAWLFNTKYLFVLIVQSQGAGVIFFAISDKFSKI